jgi:hypothetical protein
MLDFLLTPLAGILISKRSSVMSTCGLEMRSTCKLSNRLGIATM